MNRHHDEVMDALEIVSEAIDYLGEIKTTVSLLRDRVRELELLCDSLRTKNADLRRELKGAMERH